MKMVTHAEILPFVSKAAKDHVSAKNTQNTVWFMFDANAEQPCFCALMRIGAAYRIKAVWVHPARRGLGIGTKMTGELLNYAVNVLKARTIQVFAYNAKFYLDIGFKKYGALPNGAQMLRIYK